MLYTYKGPYGSPYRELKGTLPYQEYSGNYGGSWGLGLVGLLEFRAWLWRVGTGRTAEKATVRPRDPEALDPKPQTLNP